MEILCRFIFNKLKVSITFCLYFSEIPWDKKHFPKKKKKFSWCKKHYIKIMTFFGCLKKKKLVIKTNK